MTMKTDSIPRPSGNPANFNHDTSQQTDELKRIQGRFSPVSILLITVMGIAVAEIIAMVVVYFNLERPYYQQVGIDALVMTIIVFPILYFLSFRPILQHIQQRHRVERVLQARLRIIQFANSHTLNEILRFTLDELEFLTGSQAGYFHFIEPDQTTINLQTWSTNTVEHMCSVDKHLTHYPVDKAGVWADSIRERKAIVHNDYEALPNRRGLPEGHAPIVREMAVPVLRDDKIVAVLGVGNKPTNYTEDDVSLVSTLADFTWDIIKQKQFADAQRESEEKFRTVADWTYDWELWLDPKGQIVYSSPSCERITGYSPNNFTTDPGLLVRIVHPDDRDFYEGHHQLIHDDKAGVEKEEYRILTRTGEERWVEHICRPVFGIDNRYLGRRVSNRDITERKRAEMELEERERREHMLMQTIYTMQIDIARDLHDTVGQNIGYLRMRLAHLSGTKGLTSTDLKAEMKNMSRVANESYDLMRGTLSMLQTADSTDLSQLFERYSLQIEERSMFRVQFSAKGEPKPIAAKRMRQLFYVYREALSNIEKHANAKHVFIEMNWEKDQLVLSIRDDGHGFNPESIQYVNHYGLKFMKERVEMLEGKLTLKSEPGGGTTITLHMPYDSPHLP